MKEKKKLNVEIGEEVKRVREQSKVTQEQFAELIGVTPQYISDLERGVVGISIPTLKRLCTAMCVTSDQILFGERPQNDISPMLEKCRMLSPEQFAIVSDIVNKFIEGIHTERRLTEKAVLMNTKETTK